MGYDLTPASRAFSISRLYVNAYEGSPPRASGGVGQQVQPLRKTRCCSSARGQTFTQITRAHREFSEEQIRFLANIVRLCREEPLAAFIDAESKKHFPNGKYQDVPGLYKVAIVKEIEAQGWSLNPGQYVGVYQA